MLKEICYLKRYDIALTIKLPRYLHKTNNAPTTFKYEAKKAVQATTATPGILTTCLHYTLID